MVAKNVQSWLNVDDVMEPVNNSFASRNKAIH